MTVIEVAVPDIGDFTDVPVIEILVAVGDAVAHEDPLVTLESDKATMDVPAPVAGTVKEITVKVGDRVSQGTTILTVEAVEEQTDQSSPPSAGGDARDAPADRAVADAVVGHVVDDVRLVALEVARLGRLDRIEHRVVDLLLGRGEDERTEELLVGVDADAGDAVLARRLEYT